MAARLPAAALLALIAGAAEAQQRLTAPALRTGTEPTIEERFDDEFGTPGMRLGGFLARLFLSEELGYDDNVFVARDKQHDFVSVTSAGGSVTSNWQRHQAFVAGSAAFLGFARFEDQNEWVGNVITGGRVDVTRDVSAGVDLSAARQIDERGDPDSIGAAAEPVIFQRYRLEPWFAVTSGRFTHNVAVQGETVNYDNSVDSRGTAINLASKEYEQTRAGYRLGYRYKPPFDTYLRLEALDRSSTNNAGIPSQNFNVYGAAVGATVPVTPVVAVLGEVGVQYVTNDNAAIGDATVPTAELRVVWEPVRSLRLEARALRDFTTSIVTGALEGSPGYVRTVAGLRAISEIRHGLVATADTFVLNRNYIDDDRDEQVFGFDIGLRYALGHGVFLAAAYLWRYEESDSQMSYSRNLFLTRITKAF